MKLLFLVYDISIRAGTERAVSMLANWFAGREGYQVVLLTSNLTNNVAAYPLSANVTIEHLSLPVYPKGKLRQMFWHVELLKRLKTRMSGETGAAVIGTWSTLNLVLAAAAESKNRYIGWEHTVYDNVDFLRKLLRKRYYRRLSAVVTLTRRDAERYRAHQVHVETVPNSSPLSSAEPAPLDAQQVLSLGRLTPPKGFDLYLEIASRLIPEYPGWRFIIAGSGPEETLLRNRISELSIGEQAEIVTGVRDVEPLYMGSSIVAVTSRAEGFPMVLLEAMSCGVPCVSFDCPYGPAEIITDGEDGFLIPPGDLSAFSEKLELLMNNAALRRKMGAAARRNVRRFSMDRIGEAWEQVVDGSAIG